VLSSLAGKLALSAYRLIPLASLLLGRLLEELLAFEFAKHPLALHLPFEGLIEVVVANDYLHGWNSLSSSSVTGRG
jgi:hypothetical protein